MGSITPTTPLKDALYAFSLAKTIPDAELLDEFIRRYPEHAAALTDFAIDLALDAARGDNYDLPATPTISPTVSRVMSRFQNALFAANRSKAVDVQETPALSSAIENPFAALDTTGIRRLGNNIHANTVFVLRLRDRAIDPASMTEGFKTRIAEELNTSFNTMEAYFSARPEIQFGQHYKSEHKPEIQTQQSFEEAVLSSGLTDEQQQYLLNL